MSILGCSIQFGYYGSCRLGSGGEINRLKSGITTRDPAAAKRVVLTHRCQENAVTLNSTATTEAKFDPVADGKALAHRLALNFRSSHTRSPRWFRDNVAL